MIPLKIQIKNFLSYGDTQTIDFSTYSLICLSGKNGHGKSALLDALTWVLWGQARKTTGVAKSDDNLIRIGQTHMMVGLQFICNSQEYRVRREYIKSSSKPYVTLDVGLLDPQQKVYVPIGGKSIRANQLTLEGILHLDFDTFCNSAFLRQGQSNEFSKKSPKERKEILASILGLNQYESIRVLASEKARLLISERSNVQAVVDRMQQDINQLEMVQGQLNVLQENFSTQELRLKELSNQEQVLEEQLNKVLVARQKEQTITLHIQQLSQKEIELRHQCAATIQSWRLVHAQQLAMGSFDKLKKKKNEIILKLKEHQTAFHDHLQRKDQYLHVKERVQVLERNHEKMVMCQLEEQKLAVERLKMEHQQYGHMLTSITQRKNDLEKEQADVNANLKRLATQLLLSQEDNQRYQSMTAQFEKRKAFYQNWITLGNFLTTELQNLSHKKLLCAVDDNPCCPLCEQNLSASRRRFLKDKLAEQESCIHHRLNRISKVIAQLKDVLIVQHKDLQELQKRIQNYQAIEVQVESFQKKLGTLATEFVQIEQQYQACLQQQTLFNNKLQQQQELLNNAQQQGHETLQSNQEYRSAVVLMKDLEVTLTSQEIDKAVHHKLAVELEQIEQSLKEWQQFSEQRGLQEQRMHEVHEYSENFKKIKQEKIELIKQLKAFEYLNDHEKALQHQQEECAVYRADLVAAKEIMLQEKGALEGRKMKLLELERELNRCRDQQKTINDRIEEFQAIGLATGKDGIQALLIQDVLPEIEQEANMLLGKLTDNQAQIFIESLRDLKKGGSKETLDINISDTMGMRPYEMFSGGEAFRIDFALRIALSKMLARRAGTSLQTLIIDEGFGSQDEEGLAHIMDALYRIQDDFAKVIVVSHLPSMKEQFPVNFYVEKKPSGSVINIIEQG